MEIQRYLRETGSLASLEATYGIRARRHEYHPNLVLLKYDAIASPMGERLVQECRGLILNQDDNWNVVARPFDKFFNYGEQHAANIDWSSAKVQEKLDGSIITIYYYNDKWWVSTSGVPDGRSQVNDTRLQFSHLFMDTLKQYDVDLSRLNTSYNYIFELMCPENRVVVRHTERKLALIGIRDLNTMRELEPESQSHIGWPIVRSFQLDSIDAIVATFTHIDPLDQEGYVVVDSQFNRIKIKHPKYVMIHHMRDNLTMRNMLQAIMLGEYAELMAYYPEWKPHFNNIINKLDVLKCELKTAFEEALPLSPDRKTFATFAKRTRIPDLMFKMYTDRQVSVDSYITNMRVDNLIDILGLKNDNQ